MREALRRRCCLWWLCLTAATTLAREAAAPVVEAEARQGQCEVLDPSLQQPLNYSLPTKLTVRPSAPGWQLDFTLWATQAKSARACVRLEEKYSRLRLLLFKGHCEEGIMQDYNYVGDASTTPRAWTSLGVDVTDDTVLVTAPDGNNTSLKANNMLLPHDGLQVTSARNVDAAVGCRVSCPAYRHASAEKDKKKTVKSWLEESVYFYFLPGSAFVRLEYEVKCTTSLGNHVFLHIADIAPNSHLPRGQWHLAHLQHSSGKATVSIDYEALANKPLTSGCTFTEHTVRVAGDGLFSFTCNPVSGKVEWIVAECGSAACPTTTTTTMPPWLAAFLALIAETTLVVVVLLAARKLRQRQATTATVKIQSFDARRG